MNGKDFIFYSNPYPTENHPYLGKFKMFKNNVFTFYHFYFYKKKV